MGNPRDLFRRSSKRHRVDEESQRGDGVDENIPELLDAILKNLNALAPGSENRSSYVAHLRSLARCRQEPFDYPQVENVTFPKTLKIAYAVCHSDCGMREFIVDGSSQECQFCGGLNYRAKFAYYQLKE